MQTPTVTGSDYTPCNMDSRCGLYSCSPTRPVYLAIDFSENCDKSKKLLYSKACYSPKNRLQSKVHSNSNYKDNLQLTDN